MGLEKGAACARGLEMDEVASEGLEKDDEAVELDASRGEVPEMGAACVGLGGMELGGSLVLDAKEDDGKAEKRLK